MGEPHGHPEAEPRVGRHAGVAYGHQAGGHGLSTTYRRYLVSVPPIECTPVSGVGSAQCAAFGYGASALSQICGVVQPAPPLVAA